LHQNVSSTTGSRETPPPLRFLGRRVYLAAIVVLIAMSPDPDWRTRSGRSRRSLHDRALAPLVTRHVHGNAILPDGARRLMPPVEHDSAPFESGLSQCCTSDLNRRLENRRIATKNSTARSG
jgi:hypothetical protein